jgi:hypothetical protein
MMPPKRKPTDERPDTDGKKPKPNDDKKVLMPSVRPSSSEKPAAEIRTYADSWPNGLSSWPAVLRAVAFQSLLEQRTEEAWSAAVDVAQSTTDEIDLSLLPPDPNRASALTIVWRVTVGGLFGHLPPELRFCMQQTVRISTRTVGDPVPDAGQDAELAKKYGTAAFDGRLRAQGQEPTAAKAAMRAAANAKPRLVAGADLQKIRRLPPDASDDKTYRMLNADPTDLHPIYFALRDGRIGVLISMLERLPVVELDRYDRKDDRFAQGLEDWFSRAFNHNHPIPNLYRIFEAARSYMILYRRLRSKLLRDLLSANITYAIFDIIDAYGAAPLRQRS